MVRVPDRFSIRSILCKWGIKSFSSDWTISICGRKAKPGFPLSGELRQCIHEGHSLGSREFSLGFFPIQSTWEAPVSKWLVDHFYIKCGPSVDHEEFISTGKFLLGIQIQWIFLLRVHNTKQYLPMKTKTWSQPSKYQKIFNEDKDEERQGLKWTGFSRERIRDYYMGSQWKAPSPLRSQIQSERN